MNSILNAGNACYSSVRNVLSFYLLKTRRNLYIEIHKTTITPVVLNV